MPEEGLDVQGEEETVRRVPVDARAKFMENYPEAWIRIQARREFMNKQLSITLAPEVLPFSNIPAYLTPYLLAPNKAMRITA